MNFIINLVKYIHNNYKIFDLYLSILYNYNFSNMIFSCDMKFKPFKKTRRRNILLIQSGDKEVRLFELQIFLPKYRLNQSFTVKVIDSKCNWNCKSKLKAFLKLAETRVNPTCQ